MKYGQGKPMSYRQIVAKRKVGEIDVAQENEGKELGVEITARIRF